jgi:hypothetical protein
MFLFENTLPEWSDSGESLGRAGVYLKEIRRM